MTTTDPFTLFQEWYAAAQRTDLPEPSAAALATVDSEGEPSVRMVLVRGMDQRGFIFYTNLGSRKARDLESRAELAGPAALCFYWAPLARQVCVTGKAVRVADAEADAYWATRDRGSQVSAWASRQSDELKGGRPELLARVAEWDARLPREDVPRPAFWSGFLVKPERIEFWQGRENRLHERTLYVRAGDSWSVRTLNP